MIAAAKKGVAAGKFAKFAPYKRVLRGGKWKLSIERKMINFRIYGRGGKELPAAPPPSRRLPLTEAGYPEARW